MGANVVEGHGLEFRSHPEITAGRHWWPSGSSRTRPAKILTSAAWLGAGVLALAVAALYAAGRGPALPVTAPPMARLGLAAAIGFILTAVHRYVRGGRMVGYSLARAQTLLCVAGALTMILIDNSVARAFGIAGAASIVRFRTPVEDPTDATVLFLSMALGMASGVGAFGLAIAGSAGVCLLLIAYGTVAPEPRRRNITIEMAAAGHEFPSQHIRDVFARHNVIIEPSEWSQETGTRVKYRAAVHENLSLETLGAELMSKGEAGLQSVSWEVRKNGS
jgi:uncharacterized membrane protein YhiD involved in acid resistance